MERKVLVSLVCCLVVVFVTVSFASAENPKGPSEYLFEDVGICFDYTGDINTDRGTVRTNPVVALKSV